MKTNFFLLVVFICGMVVGNAQKIVASPSPTPAITATLSPSTTVKKVDPKKDTITTETIPSESKKCRISGGARIVSRYHGGNGSIFRNSGDQNLWAEVECPIAEKVSVYGGAWGAAQFKEIDANVGVRYNSTKVSVDGQYQVLYLFDGEVVVHNLNVEVSTPIFKKDKLSVSGFGRIETYFTQKHANLPGGSYFIAGAYTNTKLNKNWNLSVTPKVLFDLNGAFGAKPGAVFLTDAEIIRQWGNVTTGPGFRFSAGNGRPTFATLRWSFYFQSR